jgi:hypothetical protein
MAVVLDNLVSVMLWFPSSRLSLDLSESVRKLILVVRMMRETGAAVMASRIQLTINIGYAMPAIFNLFFPSHKASIVAEEFLGEKLL